MKFRLSNFRGVKSAEIELSKLTLVGGRNYQGKSSIAQGCAAVLAAEPLPIPGMKKKDAAVLVHAGQKTGSIEYSNGADNGAESAKLKYPGAEFSGNITPCSKQAVGIESLLDMDKTTRTRELIGLLSAEPTMESLVERARQNGIPKDFPLDKLTVTVIGAGWDGAYEKAKEVGARLKGAWEQITGQRYGSQKADTWMPDGYTEQQLATPIAEIESGLAKAEAEKAKAGTAKAVTAAVTAAVTEAAKAEIEKKIKDLTGQKTTLMQDLAKLEPKLDPAKEAFLKLSPPSKQSTQACPYCNNALAVDNGRIVKSQLMTKETRAALEKKYEDAKKMYDDLHAGITAIKGQLSNIDFALKIEEDKKLVAARTPVAQAPAATEAPDRTPELRARLAAVKAKTEADEKRTLINYNAVIQEILKPAGLRKEVLTEKLLEFNSHLKSVCDTAAWLPVSVTDDMDVLYNGRPVALASASEAFFVRLALQICVATRTSSPAIIADGVDIVLNKEQRNGIFKAIIGAGIPAIICMTFTRREDMPNLASVGGQGYWIESGRVE